MTGEGVEADEDEEQVEQGDHLHLWEPDGESGGLVKLLEAVIWGEDKYKQALWSVCFRANQNALQLTKLLHRCAF